MMILKYQNDIEDFVAFNRYVYEHGPLFKRQLRSMAAFVFVVGVVATLFASTFVINIVEARFDAPAPRLLRAATLALGLLASAVVGVASFYAWKPIALHFLERNVRHLYRQTPDPLAIAEQELELHGDWLIDRTPQSESRVKLQLIDDIVETQLHVYIRLSAMRAYILPRRSFAQGELETFLDELTRAHAQPPRLPDAGAPLDAIQIRPGR